MIKVKNISESELKNIAKDICDAFMAEDGGFPRSFSYEDCLIFLEAEIRIICEIGRLYTFSENKEGYAAYWLKKDRPSLRKHFKMAYYILRKMPLKRYMVFANNMKGWKGYETIYKDEDYVDFFMVAVKPEHQGKGLLRQALNDAFKLAEENGVKCVLDTDSKLKADKYQHVGMKLVKEQELESGIHMYTIER